MHSSVPVVVVNPKVKPSPKVDHILFPMGTSSKVKPLFRRVLKLAKELNSKVTILAQVEFPIQPMAQYKDFVGPQGMASLGTFVKGERKRLLAEGNILKSLAESSGVKAAVEVGDSVTPIADKILSFAQAKNVGLIAMGNASGPIGSVLLGSVSREVVRRSEVPVWILHHSTTKKKKKK
jgi:nucleotide-binding universal stress UspA family protein